MDNTPKHIKSAFEVHGGPSHYTTAFTPLGINRLFVEEGVLCPENSTITRMFAAYLYDNSADYKTKEVLEIGCGSGILSVIMAKNGAKKIVSTDILKHCAANTMKNFQELELEDKMDIRTGDLFAPLRIHETFDLIIINHPYFYGTPNPKNPLEVAIMDDETLCERFFSGVHRHLKSDGKILMGYSDRADGYNDPVAFAAKNRFSIREVAQAETKGFSKYVYELVMKSTRRI